MNESFAGNLFQMALTWFLVLPLLLCAVGNYYVHRVGSMKDWERLQRAWRWGRHWMWSTHWWGRDWGLHQASSHWDHETTMAPLGRPALPTRPYPNICGTAQYLTFCLGHYAICLDCFTNCLGCSAPTNGKISHFLWPFAALLLGLLQPSQTFSTHLRRSLPLFQAIKH